MVIVSVTEELDTATLDDSTMVDSEVSKDFSKLEEAVAEEEVVDVTSLEAGTLLAEVPVTAVDFVAEVFGTGRFAPLTAGAAAEAGFFVAAAVVVDVKRLETTPVLGTSGFRSAAAPTVRVAVVAGRLVREEVTGFLA